MIDKQANKKRFEELLYSTVRDGIYPIKKEDIDHVLDCLSKWGFFEAPASAGYHLNEPGGLAQHSLNVYSVASKLKPILVELKPEVESSLPDDSIILSTLLHDVCKSDIYKLGQKFRKDENGRWEAYEAYNVDYHLFPLGHGEKSVIMLLRAGLQLSIDEMIAIRWHMSAWDLAFQSAEAKSSLNAAKERCPLLSLLQAADCLSAGIIE